MGCIGWLKDLPLWGKVLLGVLVAGTVTTIIVVPIVVTQSDPTQPPPPPVTGTTGELIIKYNIHLFFDLRPKWLRYIENYTESSTEQTATVSAESPITTSTKPPKTTTLAPKPTTSATTNSGESSKTSTELTTGRLIRIFTRFRFL